ncbi:hypothetical protein FS749_006432 [Ceratobasidium sp. UAMH 11750]|nr:hypothetical protein FS749_006432 [Ceratobasidium sp. UAMH 11750]
MPSFGQFKDHEWPVAAFVYVILKGGKEKTRNLSKGGRGTVPASPRMTQARRESWKEKLRTPALARSAARKATATDTNDDDEDLANNMSSVRLGDDADPDDEMDYEPDSGSVLPAALTDPTAAPAEVAGAMAPVHAQLQAAMLAPAQAAALAPAQAAVLAPAQAAVLAPAQDAALAPAQATGTAPAATARRRPRARGSRGRGSRGRGSRGRGQGPATVPGPALGQAAAPAQAVAPTLAQAAAAPPALGQLAAPALGQAAAQPPAQAIAQAPAQAAAPASAPVTRRGRTQAAVGQAAAGLIPASTPAAETAAPASTPVLAPTSTAADLAGFSQIPAEDRSRVPDFLFNLGLPHTEPASDEGTDLSDVPEDVPDPALPGPAVRTDAGAKGKGKGGGTKKTQAAKTSPGGAAAAKPIPLAVARPRRTATTVPAANPPSQAPTTAPKRGRKKN